VSPVGGGCLSGVRSVGGGCLSVGVRSVGGVCLSVGVRSVGGVCLSVGIPSPSIVGGVDWMTDTDWARTLELLDTMVEARSSRNIEILFRLAIRKALIKENRGFLRIIYKVCLPKNKPIFGAVSSTENRLDLVTDIQE
jgi:hypothetical protein